MLSGMITWKTLPKHSKHQGVADPRKDVAGYDDSGYAGQAGWGS